jgi:hypothetical protein
VSSVSIEAAFSGATVVTEIEQPVDSENKSSALLKQQENLQNVRFVHPYDQGTCDR